VLDKLIATNRDLMWISSRGRAVPRIDGGQPDARWAKGPGVLWTALVPYDETLRRVYEAQHSPASWGGLASTPWYVALQRGRLPEPRR